MGCSAKLRELLRHVYVAEDRKLAIVLEETKARLAEITELELGIAEDLTKREDAARSATQKREVWKMELSPPVPQPRKRCCAGSGRRGSASISRTS